MVHSMTAYGRAEDSKGQVSISCEIRSVNHRYLEISIRAPEELRFLEQKIREIISHKLKRGKIDCNIRTDQHDVHDEKILVNHDLIKKLIETVEKINIDLKNSSPLNVLDLLHWPGVLEQNTLDPEIINERLFKLLSEAVDAAVDTRQHEGVKIRKFIIERCEKVKKIISSVQSKMPIILDSLREKLTLKAKELTSELDNDRLEQELLLLSQKMDISEEIDRLYAHTVEVIRVLEQGGPIGRRLDFLMQEMNRESNTLGSKTYHLDTSKASVELKVLIEQMREQIQNIE